MYIYIYIYIYVSGGTERATCVNMPLLRLQSSEEIQNVSRNRAHTQGLLQARKSHIYGSGTFGASWVIRTARVLGVHSIVLHATKCE